MRFAKIAATVFGLANTASAGPMGNIGSATTTTSGGHSAKKVIETVHCGQYPSFRERYGNEWTSLKYNNEYEGTVHGAIAQAPTSTAYIPADKYVNNKWCVTLDLKLKTSF